MRCLHCPVHVLAASFDYLGNGFASRRVLDLRALGAAPVFTIRPAPVDPELIFFSLCISHRALFTRFLTQKGRNYPALALNYACLPPADDADVMRHPFTVRYAHAAPRIAAICAWCPPELDLVKIVDAIGCAAVLTE